MNIRKLLSTAAASVMAVSLLCSCGQSGALKLGTGNTGGNYYSYGTMLHELDENGIEVKKTAGSQANLRLMNEGFIDMAIVQRFAVLNRATMAEIIIKAMGFTEVSRFETIHNYIDFSRMILRK